MTNPLIEKALSVRTKKQSKKIYSEEEVELALLWVKDGVSLRQVGIAMGSEGQGMTAYIFLANALKQHINK